MADRLCNCGCGGRPRVGANWCRYHKSAPPLKRFVECDRGHGSPCWLWQGCIDDGYGTLNIGYKKIAAHRFFFEKLRAAIPDGLVIDHLCLQKDCVNPDHLEPVEPGENSRRAIRHGLGGPPANARKTHCPAGHEYSPENTRLEKNGRRCLACKRISSRSFRRRRKDGEALAA